MLGDLLKRLAALSFTLLAMALSALAVLVLLPEARKDRIESNPPSEEKASQSPFFDVQERTSEEAPWYGEVHTPLAPGKRFFISRKIVENRNAVGQSLMTMAYEGKTVTQVAFGTDDIPYFVNGFFLDFSPEPVRHIWEAHRKLQLRLRYQLDSRHFPGRREVWQTSRQTFKNLRGDCEDLAIFLADWLAAEGYDARVVVGTHRKEGHAWVVVFLKGRAFLIEATSRRPARRYPLASTMRAYYPVAMFNRDTFWLNTGSPLTSDYTSKRWEKRSEFVRLPGPVRFPFP